MNNFMSPYPQPNYFNANYQMPQAQAFGQAPPTRQSNVDWVYVNGIQGARDQIVQPGCQSWMMDNNDPVIYYKSVDQMGQPTLRAYQLTEITANTPAQQAPAPQIDLSELATKNDLAAVNEKIEKLIAEIGGMNV